MIPRNLKKVHFYFQGGGACWDRASTWAHFCSQTASPINGNNGIFDPNNAENPYADYTVIAVLYCSGDVHIGNVTQNYDTEPESGIPTVQSGYINSISTATWAQQQGLGTLDHLVVSGSSAGALGTQAAADFIPEFVESNQVSVIIDSYVGVFDCLGPLLERYGRLGRQFYYDCLLRFLNTSFFFFLSLSPHPMPSNLAYICSPLALNICGLPYPLCTL